MFNRLSSLILKYPKTIIFIILLVTGPSFWLSFISDDRLKVDFSLELLPTSCKLKCDPYLLTRALVNLLSNIYFDLEI